MAYIIKNTAGLINTRLTDVGRRKLSQGNFNIKYFQIGDSEVNYKALPNYNQSNNYILEAAYNAQNNAGAPQSNKGHVKYPFYLNGSSGNTYGIPFQESRVDSVFNTAAPRGFFTGSPGSWSAKTTSWTSPVIPPPCPTQYPDVFTISSNYVTDLCNKCSPTTIILTPDFCSPTTGTPKVGDLAVIYYDGEGSCGVINGKSYPILTYQIVAVNGLTITLDRPILDIEGSQGCVTTTTTTIPTTTTTTTFNINCDLLTELLQPLITEDLFNIILEECVITTTTTLPPLNNFISTELLQPLMTENFLDLITEDSIFTTTTTTILNTCCSNARVLIYPSGMTPYYDSNTPQYYWPNDVINFESICDLGNTDVRIWNMNIPWTESPAGLDNIVYEGYNNYGSIQYIGSKEYFGYQTNSAQTFFINAAQPSAITDTFYYNSFDELVEVLPDEQKAIAILHYTNNAIDSFYGEKFALEPYDPQTLDTVGFARNFKIHIPWLMWHKSTKGSMGETFYVDPAGFNVFDERYMQSGVNADMNDPGLRYYHLWDTYPNSNGQPSRIGKVFPDLKQIVIDDEEVVAALSYKADRNWTLPAPKATLVTPNICDDSSPIGVMSSDTECMYVTWRFDTPNFTNSLHCNYYTRIQGPATGCTQDSQNVAVRFGNEFPFLTKCCLQGFQANEFKIIAQKVVCGQRPSPSAWRIIDYTAAVTGGTGGSYILPSDMVANTFVITKDLYDSAPFYDLGQYMSIPTLAQPDILNFGDEYFFYGNLETDIQATIYEMRYLCNLTYNQFNNTSNPSWTSGTTAYITEIGLYDENKNLIVISKLQSPQIRQGIQQFLIKLDF